MPFIKIHIHLVWTTKDREPLLDSPQIRKTVWQHIHQYAKEKNIFLDCVNGHAEHCHALLSMSSGQTIDKTMQLLKGESSFWINQQGLIPEKFGWQDEYFAVSVSESMIPKVRKYIHDQEEHHRRKSFQEEYDQFIRAYGFRPK